MEHSRPEPNAPCFPQNFRAHAGDFPRKGIEGFVAQVHRERRDCEISKSSARTMSFAISNRFPTLISKCRFLPPLSIVETLENCIELTGRWHVCLKPSPTSR